MSGDAREQVIKIAMRCFAAQGYEGTSLQWIAEEMGVTKSAILHHFSSKEQLRMAVLSSILAHWKETLPRVLLAATAASRRFDAVFDALYSFFSEDPDRAKLILRETMDRPEETKVLLREQVRTWLDVIAAYIREGQEKGRHHGDVDADLYVFLILRCVLAVTASVGLSEALYGSDAAQRQAREMARIAKISLFRQADESERENTYAKGREVDPP
ncbi:TetR/AcrR family transcriptional regulator [Myxococcota bacterium]|nr:TetR/AcrR family transcriptional regulator [Myxococcota bacterium]